MEIVYEVTVRFKNGSNTKSVFFSAEEVLRYIDETIGDDYLYDGVSDWLGEKHGAGDSFVKYPITIFTAEK